MNESISFNNNENILNENMLYDILFNNPYLQIMICIKQVRIIKPFPLLRLDKLQMHDTDKHQSTIKHFSVPKELFFINK